MRARRAQPLNGALNTDMEWICCSHVVNESELFARLRHPEKLPPKIDLLQAPEDASKVFPMHLISQRWFADQVPRGGSAAHHEQRYGFAAGASRVRDHVSPWQCPWHNLAAPEEEPADG